MSMARPLKHLLKRSDLLVQWVRRYRQWRRVRSLKGPRLVSRFARLYPDAFFIQVGSNDGEQLDPLRRVILSSRWRGVMIEPVPYVFERLKRNYGHINRLQLVNAAIAEREGMLPFWHLKQSGDRSGIPEWYDALGSFRKDVILKHKEFISDIEDRVVCTDVPAETFNGLCERLHINAVDLIQMDTEGYDYEIIRCIDFSRFRPRLLIYEHHHFDKATRRECEDYLRSLGYDMFSEGMDTWCLDMSAGRDKDRRLIRYWQKLVD